MRQVNVTETFSAGDTYKYWHITDVHLGSRNCDEAALRNLVSEIQADPMARWSMGGDIGDLITPKDKRFLGSELSERYRRVVGRIPDAVIEHACEIFQPIADKCWFWGIGNHETSIAAYYDRGIGAEIAAKLGVAERYIGYKGFCCVQFAYDKSVSGSVGTLVIDFHHGWQAGRLYGAFHVYAERMLGESPAHIIVRGHSHKRQAQLFNWHRPGREHPYQENRVVAVCGSWVHSNDYVKGGIANTDRMSEVEDDNYATRKGFRPSDPLGPPLITIKPSAGGTGNGSGAFDLGVRL